MYPFSLKLVYTFGKMSVNVSIPYIRINKQAYFSLFHCGVNEKTSENALRLFVLISTWNFFQMTEIHFGNYFTKLT